MNSESSTPQPATRRSFLPKILIGSLSTAGLVLLGWFFFGGGDDNLPGDSPPGAALSPWTPPSTDGYVGSVACASCHSEIVELYKSHPMSRSITLVDPEAPEGLLPPEQTRVTGRRRFFEVDVAEGVMRHHEKMMDSSGEVIYDQAVSMDYVVGSGTHAKSYIYHRGSLLFMSPLNWFSTKQVWDVAPGYLLDDERRFDRQVIDACLNCHAGRPAVIGRAQDRFQKPAFHEMAIGCENCHGPGQKHIEFQELADDDRSGKDPIVNPAKLKPLLQESVCNQCHHLADARVLRHGRSHFDFRPGMDVDEIWTFLDASSRMSSDGRVTAVSHLQQMRRSRCFSESDGRLGCISCHDPHSVPSAAERMDFFRKRCLDCHEEAPCSAPQSQRQAENDSCIACHMPRRGTSNVSHVSQTDHRIIRRRGASPVGKTEVVKLELPESAAKMTSWEQERAFLVGNWEYLDRRGVEQGQELLNRLMEASKTGPADRAILGALGLTALRFGQHDVARQYFERQKDLAHAEFSARSNLLSIYYQASEFAAASECVEDLLKIDPGSARFLSLRADILLNLGQPDEAIAAAELALQQNPTLDPVRVWLIEQLNKAGREEERMRHEQILRRMETATIPAVPGLE